MKSPEKFATKAIRVLVVEDNFYTRLGTVAFLRSQPGIEVVDEAASGPAALALFDQHRPDVTTVDVRLSGMDGIQMTSALRARRPDARVLVFTHHAGEEDIYRALQAGARGYLTKEAPGSDLTAAIAAVHSGARFLPQPIAELLASRMLAPTLTCRERDVLERIARGATNREIARELKLSERTVELYVSGILNKLDARGRTEAVAIARRRGIVRDEE